MESEIAKELLRQGLLGVVALVAMYVAWRMYKDAKATQKEMTKKLEEQHARHREELKGFIERYMVKADTMTEKNFQLTKEMVGVVSLLERRWGKGD